jgi:PilZ domain/RDD family
MEYPSHRLISDQNSSSTGALPGRRLYYRQRVSTLAYVNLDHSNGGIVRDLSEAGLAIQAVSPLRLNQQVQLRFLLLRPRLQVETQARVAWADSRGQAGVQFINSTDRSRRSLKQWIFTQLLVRADQATRMGSIFAPDHSGPGAPELLYSASPRPAIRLQPGRDDAISDLLDRDDDENERKKEAALLLYGLSVPRRAFAHTVDALILVSAVLIFSILAMAVTRIVPSSAVALALGLAVTCIFATLYWFLFAAWNGATPGECLAQIAGHDSMVSGEKDRPRFR